MTPITAITPESPPAELLTDGTQSGNVGSRPGATFTHAILRISEGSTQKMLFSESLFIWPGMNVDIASIIRADLRRRRTPAARYSIEWRKPSAEQTSQPGLPVSGRSIDILHNITDSTFNIQNSTLPILLTDTTSLLLNPLYTPSIPITVLITQPTTGLIIRARASFPSGPDAIIWSKPLILDTSEESVDLGIRQFEIPIPRTYLDRQILTITIEIASALSATLRESDSSSLPSALSATLRESDSSSLPSFARAMRVFLTSRQPAAEIRCLNQYLCPQLIQCFGKWNDTTESTAETALVLGSRRPLSPEIKREITIESEPLDTETALARALIAAADTQATIRLFTPGRYTEFQAIITQSKLTADPSDHNKNIHTITCGRTAPASAPPTFQPLSKIFTEQFTEEFQ